ncbi:MAG: VanZ family protein [Halanaerobiales bacterium]|nr:VanZ family protein [Halanaerobiales bacterium]
MNWRKLSEYLSALILLGYMGLIFYLSSIPGSEIHVTTPDYILHGLAFGGLAFLFMVFFLHHLNMRMSIIFSFVLTFLFALSDEAHQYFVPFRTPDWCDIFADLVGAIIFQIGLFILIRVFSYKKRLKR